jgi:hypothetical protein
VFSIGGGDMITSDTKILEDSGYGFNMWTQLAVIMIKVGIIKDIFDSLGYKASDRQQGLDITKLVDAWREIQMQTNPSVEKLNRGQFYIGALQKSSNFSVGFDSSWDRWGVFYVNPLSKEEWESDEHAGLIYFGANTMALICKDEQENEGKKMTERTSLLKIDEGYVINEDFGYNSTLSDVTILNEPDENGFAPWSMGYDQSWFERKGWKFYPITLHEEEETLPQFGLFNWWW